MKLSVIAIGRDRSGAEIELFERYAARLRPELSLTTLGDGVGTATEIKRREAKAILAKLRPRDYVVALDEGGVLIDTAGLAGLLDQWRLAGNDCVFIVGGAEGLDASILDRAAVTLSLGKLTFPHLLARAILAEQLYRAQSILSGHPYHRASHA